MSKRKKTRLKLRFQVKILIVLIAIISLFTVGVFAKYIMSYNGTANVKVDKVYYTVVKDQAPSTVGNVVTFYFNVNNFDGDLINQVLMKYYLKINGLDSTVLDSYKLYLKDSGGTWNELSKITTGTYANYYLSTSNLEFGSKKTHNYKLELTLKEHLPITTDYDFTVDLKLIQTK